MWVGRDWTGVGYVKALVLAAHAEDVRRARRSGVPASWPFGAVAALFRSQPVKAASRVASSKEIIMDELQGIVRLTFHAGMVEEFKRLSAECMEIVRSKDVGTLQYDTHFNDDDSQAIVLERFRDSDALILHGQNMAP